MEPELIAEASRLLDELERGVAADPGVDWTVAPPEEGSDPRYALGYALAQRCLEEPLLAPLAEALTRPQRPARPDPARAHAFLHERRWENPFVLVCGRLLQRGPWSEVAVDLADALERLGRRGAEISPIVARLILASQTLEPAPHAAPVPAPPVPGTVRAAPSLLINQVTAPAPTPAAATAKHFLALCAIFKNEARYLREWIEFHRIVGVDHFYLYENESTDDYASVLEPYVANGIVTLHHWPVEVGQNPAYTHCLTDHADEVEWVAFVDADEFFYAPGADLRRTLAEYDRPDVGGVSVNYVNYGTSGHKATPGGLVLENYLRRAGHETAVDLPAGLKAPHLDPTDLRNYHPLNARISSVVRPARAARFEIPHYPVYKPGFHAVTENFERLDGAIAPQTSVARLRMNHYWTKSEQECKAKFERGRSDQAGTRKWPDDFLRREQALNEVVDVEILAWLPQLRAAMGVGGPTLEELVAAAEARWPRAGEHRLSPQLVGSF